MNIDHHEKADGNFLDLLIVYKFCISGAEQHFA